MNKKDFGKDKYLLGKVEESVFSLYFWVSLWKCSLSIKWFLYPAGTDSDSDMIKTPKTGIPNGINIISEKVEGGVSKMQNVLNVISNMTK